MVLFLGSREDPHIGRILSALGAEGNCNAAVLDLKTSLFDLRTSVGGSFSLEVDGLTIPPTAAVFDRTMFRKGTAFYPAGEAEFTMEEFSALYRLIAETFAERVINPLRSRLCMVKPHQQVVAAAAGFLVPRTVVSNDKSALVGFVADRSEHFIIKPLGQPTLHPDQPSDKTQLILTNKVDLELLRRKPSGTFARCPAFLQDEIAKRYELRVVYVGSSMFAFRIDSQLSDMSHTDWRRLSTKLEYLPYDIAPETAAAIERFMRSMGLIAGHLDLVVDHDGEVWFLECNNQGAWGWLDDVVGGEI